MTDSARRPASPNAQAHLSDDSIVLWLDNELPDDELPRFESHLENCQTCEERVEQIIHDRGGESLVAVVARGLRHTIDLRRDAMMEETSVERLRPDQHAGRPPFGWTTRFRRLGIHASGGQGIIWRAFETPIGREVAIKELRPEHLGSLAIETRLIREARLTGRLCHPGIVPVHRLEVSGRSVFYSMPLLRGEPFSQRIREFHRRPDDHSTLRLSDFHKIIDAYLSVCLTIEFAHSRDVIHRDIKSDNVIVGEFGEVTVLDWGLAKDLSQTPDPEMLNEADQEMFSNAIGETQFGEKLGTPAYMAPEQVRGDTESIGKQSDVYGLAAMLYEILTGSPPFHAVTVAETFRRILEDDPVPPSILNPAVPDELESICLRGLAKQLDQRIASASEMGILVRRWKVAQIERRRSDAERQRFFDFSADMMAILDDSHTIRAANHAWERTLGWSAEHVVGRAQLEFLHPNDREMVQAYIRQVHQGEIVQHVEVRLKHRDGGYRWTLWNATPIRDEKQIYVIGRDITERKRHERLLECILDTAPVAMMVADGRAQVIGANARLRRWLNVQHAAHVGRPISDFIAADPPARKIQSADLDAWSQQQEPATAMPPLSLLTPKGAVSCPQVDVSALDVEDARYFTLAIHLPANPQDSGDSE